MDIEILYTLNKSDLGNERIVLKASSDCNIGAYILFNTNYTAYDKEYISNKLHYTYWFPNKNVKAGDKIILYTKKGSEKLKINSNGSKSHFFYWNLEEPVWAEDLDCAVVAKIESYIVR